MITDRTLDRAWEAWSKVWDPKDRDKNAFKFALQDKLDDDQFREAARLALSECRYFPTPYDISKLAPPAKKEFIRKTVPNGFTDFGGMDRGVVTLRSRAYERAFNAVGENSTSPVWGCYRRLVATQYVLAKEEINRRESSEEIHNGTERSPDAEQGVLGLEGGAVESVGEKEAGLVGVRPDRG